MGGPRPGGHKGWPRRGRLAPWPPSCGPCGAEASGGTACGGRERPAKRFGPHLWQPVQLCARRPWSRGIGGSQPLASRQPLLPWPSERIPGGKQSDSLFISTIYPCHLSPVSQAQQPGGTCPKLSNFIITMFYSVHSLLFKKKKKKAKNCQCQSRRLE